MENEVSGLLYAESLFEDKVPGEKRNRSLPCPGKTGADDFPHPFLQSGQIGITA
jgi:hypothetical protein